MPLGVTAPEMSKLSFAFEPVPFAVLPGWEEDNHLQALRAFIRSSSRVLSSAETSSTKTAGPSPPLLAACHAAIALPAATLTPVGAKDFFEKRFTPHRVVHDGVQGLLTGYYEPLLEGSRTPEGPYEIPIYRRPPD